MSTSWLILFSAIFMCTLSGSVTGHMESKLIDDLLKTYSKYARPVRNSTDIVNIRYDLIYEMIDLDEVKNTQTLIVFELMFWTDEILVWNPTLYEGIKEIRIDSNSIWAPDMTPYNSISEVDAERGQGTAVIRFNGYATLVRIMKSKVRCEFDTHNFPFDSANCLLIIGPWVHSSFHVNLTIINPEVDLLNYKNHLRWNLVNATVERRSEKYSCCPETYYSIAYKNEFVRISNDYVIALLVPSFILSILTILLFMLPNDSSEKITLGILLFCAFFVILLYTNSVLPPADTTPYFVVFLMFNLIMISLITFLNALIVYLSNCEFCQDVPKILRSVVLEIIAKRFRMTSIMKRNMSRHMVAPQHEFNPEHTNFYTSVSSDKQPLGKSADDQSNDELVNAKTDLASDVAFITAFTRSYWQKAKDREDKNRFCQEWKDVGQVINRSFCVLYIPVLFIAVGVNLIRISS